MTDHNFLFDTDQLSQLTNSSNYKQGLTYFKNDHVMEVMQSQGQLMALVEENNSEMPLQLLMSYGADQQLQVECDCGSDQLKLCQHAVAALLSFSHKPTDENYLDAMETAIRDRVKRGQTEVTAQPILATGWFGSWQASSLISTGPWQRSYSVEIRSLTEKKNYCSCPDFAINQLGTCKHIEAALYQITKNELQTKTSNVKPFIYHSGQAGSAIKLQRANNISPELSSLLNTYFDAQGDFIGRLPEDFFSLTDSLYGCDELIIGSDAKQAVEHTINEQTHKLSAQTIAKHIESAGGRLPGIKAKLYPYQVEGVAFLAGNGRGLLADDMGLGKTLQAISASSWLINESGVKKILIVCPASLKQQWAREIEKFSAYSTQIIQGSAKERQAQYRSDKTFFIANYELILRDLTVINQTLKTDLIILDEAQRIKNWRTKIATAIKMLNSKYSFVLSGTPLENRLEDLYSLMQVVDPKVLGPLWRYLNDYHICDEKGKVLGYRNLSELRQKMSSIMLRRNRSVVSSQLPDRTTTRLDIPMTEQQLELHNSALSAASMLADIAKRRALTPSERNRLMAALQQARMACDAAGLVDKEIKGSPKLKELKTLVEELCVTTGEKMVIFSQWRGMTNMIAEMLDQMSVGFVHLHGGVPTKNRGNLIQGFNNDDSISVFLSTDAGGTGLNLQTASVLVNVDIPWNPAILEQRNGRIHRLGQAKKVQIILLIAQDSYEQRVYQLVNNKQNLFDNVVSPDAKEDVVGVSKQALATLIDDLNKDKKETEESVETASQEQTESPDMVSNLDNEEVDNKTSEDSEPTEDQTINHSIAALQRQFGPRISQMLAKGGGLLLILDKVTAKDEQFSEQLKINVPVALIDATALRQLQRLGVDSPVNDATPIELPELQAAPKPWLQQAKKNLNAAQMLLEQNLDNGVLELLACSIAAIATNMANLNDRMPIEQLTVWIYSEALPQQWLTEQQASQISCLLGLRNASQIPEALLQQVYNDTSAFIAPYLTEQ